LDRLIGYLRFKARGVPRRLLQEFNALVVWEAGQPSLLVDDAEWERISFYADLEEVVSRATRAGERGASGRVAVDDDRALLGGYHVVDWALRSRGRPFTSADVTGADGIDPLLRMAQSAVERMLRRLARAGVLDVVSESGRPDATRYGRAGSALAYYKLSDAYRRQLAGFARAGESEHADLGALDPRRGEPDTLVGRLPAGSPAAPDAAPAFGTADAAPYPRTPFPGTAVPAAWRPSAEPPDRRPVPTPTPAVGVLADRYEMTELLGQGGMGAVYRGRDVLTGQPVAVKVMHSALRDDVEMRARFEREVRISAALTHPHIVHTLDTLTGPDVEPALIMELIDGPSLGDVLERHGGLPAPLVARLARQLGEALAFIDGVGVSRIDLKPGNVLLHPRRGAVIIDLGIARPRLDADSVTQVGMVIGTPGYMAPEQVNGAPADIRADLFTLGLILHQSLTGRPVWPVATAAELFFHIINDDVPVDALPASRALREAIGRLLARVPDERPRDPEEFLALLAETPEAREDPGDDDLLSALPQDGPSPDADPDPPRPGTTPPAPTTIVVDR
jgi:serine/threonine-protein kinase